MTTNHPPLPIHISGTPRGEARVRETGKEPGRARKNGENYRMSRDSTSINSDFQCTHRPAHAAHAARLSQGCHESGIRYQPGKAGKLCRPAPL